ncbi:NAD(P)-binding protein [Paenibacillus filicis]|uniref:NAD(P)-binding protein n=1 Tax=Paenibacillus gyeongsangnamensis TaxID=3388067 RepID=A0ABT4QID3_9BACL|nr:NAD(P)-binding protein [Paenibacillus filicis]MCZ8516645.1 NAD(P)-binding protein [Paenibacillus filicis]
MNTYDVIMIGSGHNALIAAAYLTRSGRSLLVLEKNDRPGGFLRTEELTLPGFKHDVYAAAHPLLLTGPAYADFREALEARGLRYINTELPTGVSMEDGQTGVFSRSFEDLVVEAERLAPGDGTVLAQCLKNSIPMLAMCFHYLIWTSPAPKLPKYLINCFTTKDGRASRLSLYLSFQPPVMW